MGQLGRMSHLIPALITVAKKMPGLNIVLRVQVQVVEDTGGHLGPILAPQDIRFLSFRPSSEARSLLAESGEQKETGDVDSSSLTL